MHIFKSSLWRHISLEKDNISNFRRDLISFNTKRDIFQEKKVEERLVPLGLLKKVMSHGF